MDEMGVVPFTLPLIPLLQPGTERVQALTDILHLAL